MSSSQCLENPPNLTPGYGGGTVQEFGGLETYVTGPSDFNLAILLLSDALGLFSSHVAVKLASSNAFLGAEIGRAFPLEQLKESGELLSAKSQFDSHVKIYPGVSHGRTVLRTKQSPEC